MSDPVSNSEIEDVLASIRRLVSENAKALKGDRGRDPAAEKLVLTPALRIDESEAPSEAAGVFAVDTDTWSDVSGGPEDTDVKGVFSHREQKSPVLVAGSGAAGADTGEDAVDTTAPDNKNDTQTPPDDGVGRVRDSASETTDAKTGPDPDKSATAESEPAASEAATALEQRIAELETEMELRPAGGASLTADSSGGGASMAAQSKPASTAATPEAEDIAVDAALGRAPETSRETVDEAADAPPRSWIEGLVAAAAAAEASRLAARSAQASGDSQGAEGRDDATAPSREEAAAAGEGRSAAGALDTGEFDSDAGDTGARSGGVAAADDSVSDADDEDADDETAGRMPFELTAAHAAPPEAEGFAAEGAGTGANEVAPDGVVSEPGSGAAQPLDEAADDDAVAEEDRNADRPGTIDEVEEIGDRADEARKPDSDEDADEAEQNAGSQEERTDEPGDAEAGPERSWVDRLIAAAATLREAPEADAERNKGDDGAAEVTGSGAGAEHDGGGAQADGASDDAADTMAETQAGGAETYTVDFEGGEEAEASATLEPLSLVDPIATETQSEAMVPEWEPVAASETADTDFDEPEAEADTVLTGPWSAQAVEMSDSDLVEEDHRATVSQAEPDIGQPVVPEKDAGDATTNNRGVEEVPISALEWEPVDPLAEPTSTAVAETGSAPELGEYDREVAASPALDGSVDNLAPIGEEDAGEDTDGSSEGMDGEGQRDEELNDLEAVRLADDDAAADAEDVAHGPQGAGQTELSDMLQAHSSQSDRDGASDEDAAAVAAADGADVDWGEAGMAAAGVAAMTTSRDDPDAFGDDHPDEGDGEEAAVGARELREAHGEDEMVIDEVMLRELVAQLVRDELQGTVGERITHNVRRLIRREIARALTLQEFER